MGGPVNLYAVVITAMALSAWNTKSKVDNTVFFSLLQRRLAFYAFGQPHRHQQIPCPASRCRLLDYDYLFAGQYLIVRGVAPFSPSDTRLTSQNQ